MSRTDWEGDGDVPPLETDGGRQPGQARQAPGVRPPSGTSIPRRHLGQVLRGLDPWLLPAVPSVSLFALRPSQTLQAPHPTQLFHSDEAFQSEDVSHLPRWLLGGWVGAPNLASPRCQQAENKCFR